MLLFLLLLAIPSAHSPTLPLSPAPEKLQPWTMQVRDQQPDDAFAAIYRNGRNRLVFVAAQHDNQNNSLTFQIIRQACDQFHFDAAIAEGFPTSRGANAAHLLNYANEKPREDGFVKGGETVPTAKCARRQGARLWGGETDDGEVKKQMLVEGFSAADVLGYYVLRTIPQWTGEQRITDAGDGRLKALVDGALVHDRDLLQLQSNVLPHFAEWAKWYEAINHKPIGAAFETEEIGPLVDGSFGTNRIGAAISRIRDAYLHRLIIRHLNASEGVLVVYGGSHLMIHRPALDAVLGTPCYVGSDMKQAAARCS